MLHKAKSSLKILAVIVAALGLATGALFVRLWFGPVSIAYFTPYLQQTLLFDRQDLTLKFDDSMLALEGFGPEETALPALRIRIVNVRIYDGKGVELLSIPSGSVGISIFGLLHGVIAPSTIEITGPKLHVDWRGEDLFADLGDSGGNVLDNLPKAVEEASSELLPFFIRELLSPPDGSTATSYLRRIRIIDANLTLHEQATNTEWVLPGTRLEFARSDNGVSLAAKGLLQKAGIKSTHIGVTGNYNGKGHETDLKISFRGLNPAQLAGQSETMVAFKALDLPLDGIVYVRVRDDDSIASAGFDLDSGAGQINLPKFYPAPLHFDQVKAKGRYDSKRKQFLINSLSLLFGQTRFDGEGLIYANGSRPGLQISGDIVDFPLLKLREYWPHHLASGGYDWVAHNIKGGVATSGQLRLNITPGMWQTSPLPESVLDFKFSFSGVQAHYLGALPPITDGEGYAKLTTRTFDLTVTEGSVGGLKMADSHLHFSDLHLPDQTGAKIDLKLSGPLPKALALIDKKPLGFPTQYGLVPESTSGNSDIRLKLAFPLSSSITLKDVDFSVDAELHKIAIPHLFRTMALDQSNLKMHVDHKGIRAAGVIALNMVPFNFTWHEKFGETKSFPTKITLEGPVSGSQWTALGLPLEDYIKGPAYLTTTLKGKGAKVMTGQGKVDFGGSEISLSRLGWSKPAGAKAGLDFRLERDGENLDFRKITYRDDLVMAKSHVILGPTDNIELAVLDHFKNGETDLKATIKRDETGQYGLVMAAKGLDARSLIQKLTESKDDDPGVDLPDFNVTAKISRLTADNGVMAHQVKALAAFRNNQWTTIDLKGKFKDSKNFSFALGPSKTGRKISFVSNDAGEWARALGLFRNAMGGALDIQGDLTGQAKDQKLKGEINIKDFKLVQAPVLGNILTVGSMTGVGDLLKGDGITFERLNIPFTFQNGAVALEKSRAYGPSIGVTMEGGVDLRYDSITLNGAIVPAYTLNSILKFVPLVGNILMGGKGEGLFALTYKISGPVAAPKVDVNHLSAFAPGFLRNIISVFDGSGGKVSPERRAAEKKAAAEAAKEKKALSQDRGEVLGLAVSPVVEKPILQQP